MLSASFNEVRHAAERVFVHIVPVSAGKVGKEPRIDE